MPTPTTRVLWAFAFTQGAIFLTACLISLMDLVEY